MNLFELSAKLRLDASEYEKGLSDAEGSANSFAAGGLSNLAKAAKTGVMAVAAVGTAAASAGATIFKLAGKAAVTGDNIDKMSQKLGISARAYQEWDAIMQHSGTTIDSMQRGMVTLSKAAENGSDAFERLGLSQEKIASMNQEELFAATITGLQKMESGTERTALAQELLGGSAKELGALLNTSAAETEKMRQAVHDLGGVMSDDAVKSAAKYQDALQDMQTATSGFVRGAAEKAIPAVTNAFRTLTKFITGPQGKALQKKLGDIIKIIAEKAAVAIPRLVSFLGDVARAIKNNIALIGGLVVAIKAIRSPVSAAVTAVGLLVGAFGLMKLTAQDVDEELANLSDSERELVENARDAASKFSEAREAFGEAFANIDTEMTDVQSAWEALQGLVDENGKIAEGHEEEVQNLLEVINGALGTQYEINEGVISQYQEMIDSVDELIEKQWAQKLLEARSESYMLAKSQLEDAQKRLGIAKLEYEEKRRIYDMAVAARDENQAAIDEYEARIGLLQAELMQTKEGTAAHNELTAALEEASGKYQTAKENVASLEQAVKDATDAVGMQGDAMLGANAQVNALIAEIGRYDEAYSEFMQGNYAETKEILESDIAYRWKHVKKGQELTKDELEQLKRDYAVMYTVYKDYWQKLEAGQAGYNEEALEQLRQQMLDLGAILDDQLNIVNDKGKSIGENIGEGIISGIQSTQDRVNSTSSGLVNGALHAMTVTAQIASPSKRGRAIGKNIGGSVGIGMEDSYDSVVRSADDLTEGIFDALDTKPTQSYVKSGNGSGWGEMLSVLRDIRDNIGNEIVMQDGTLVGWMDKQLGKLAARKVRGTV